jgi:tetratricopeptide (TPR) repeat protein
VAARVFAKNRIQEVKVLAALLLIILPAAGQSQFKQFDRDLTRAAAELHISDLRAEVSERGRLVWHRGAVHVPARTVSVETQEVEGQHIEWWFQARCLTIELPAKRLALVVFSNSKSLAEAPRLEDGNILRSSIALAFLRDIAAIDRLDREELIAHAFTTLYVGDRDASVSLVHQALDKFPELESTPDVTLLYLFAQLGLPQTEASATAVIKAHPSLPTAWFYYGQYLENGKRYREAAACFEKITMHEPPWHNWTVAAAAKELKYLKTY